MHNTNSTTAPARAEHSGRESKEEKEGDALHVGSARDVTGRTRALYRALEMLPATLSWGTLGLVVMLSLYQSTLAAYLIILFALYWLLKTIYLSLHLRHNWRRLRAHMAIDWTDRLAAHDGEHVRHLIVLPFYHEPRETLTTTLETLANADGDPQQRLVVLAAEERAGEAAVTMARAVAREYEDRFGAILVTEHPAHVPGEMPGKGANISYAAEQARQRLLDHYGIPYTYVLVSAFDADTHVYPQYFQCLNYHFLTADRPMRTSFQPVPLFNNNIWDAPLLARVVAVSASFWQMVQQERPEKLATFSSHAVPFEPLWQAGYWQRNIVSEDSRIYWNLFFHFRGDYRVVPLAYPVSMDANFGDSLWETIVRIYKQQRRWTWGVENVPYVIFQSLRHTTMPVRARLKAVAVQVEGFWSLATHPLILFLLGWLPILIGTRAFHVTMLSYTLPTVARGTLTLAMGGLVVSAIISLSLLPPRPAYRPRRTFVFLVLQWLLVPVTMIVFSAVPGLETQTRLAIGRYLGFWVTPKRASTGSNHLRLQES